MFNNIASNFKCSCNACFCTVLYCTTVSVGNPYWDAWERNSVRPESAASHSAHCWLVSIRWNSGNAVAESRKYLLSIITPISRESAILHLRCVLGYCFWAHPKLAYVGFSLRPSFDFDRIYYFRVILRINLLLHLPSPFSWSFHKNYAKPCKRQFCERDAPWRNAHMSDQFIWTSIAWIT